MWQVQTVRSRAELFGDSGSELVTRTIDKDGMFLHGH